jgi:hypothetical protein
MPTQQQLRDQQDFALILSAIENSESEQAANMLDDLATDSLIPSNSNNQLLLAALGLDCEWYVIDKLLNFASVQEKLKTAISGNDLRILERLKEHQGKRNPWLMYKLFISPILAPVLTDEHLQFVFNEIDLLSIAHLCNDRLARIDRTKILHFLINNPTVKDILIDQMYLLSYILEALNESSGDQRLTLQDMLYYLLSLDNIIKGINADHLRLLARNLAKIGDEALQWLCHLNLLDNILGTPENTRLAIHDLAMHKGNTDFGLILNIMLDQPAIRGALFLPENKNNLIIIVRGAFEACNEATIYKLLNLNKNSIKKLFDNLEGPNVIYMAGSLAACKTPSVFSRNPDVKNFAMRHVTETMLTLWGNKSWSVLHGLFKLKRFREKLADIIRPNLVSITLAFDEHEYDLIADLSTISVLWRNHITKTLEDYYPTLQSSAARSDVAALLVRCRDKSVCDKVSAKLGCG